MEPSNKLCSRPASFLPFVYILSINSITYKFIYLYIYFSNKNLAIICIIEEQIKYLKKIRLYRKKMGRETITINLNQNCISLKNLGIYHSSLIFYQFKIKLWLCFINFQGSHSERKLYSLVRLKIFLTVFTRVKCQNTRCTS